MIATPNTPSPAPALLTERQAAAMLAVSVRTLYSFRKSGRLPAVMLGRAIRYELADIERFIASAKGEGEPRA